jgi:tetratricopeptide (TPR) repeat protein
MATPVPARRLPAQFTAARQLVFDGQYAAAVMALQALRDDDHPEVAAYVGLAHRGLGRVVEARTWYDKALHADPSHLLALLFDGMLRAEQGDLRVARDNLERVAQACGNRSCAEYLALEEVIVRVSR